MNLNFECHITVDKPLSSSIQREYELLARDLGWTTSIIDGDPYLGQKPYFYFTTHSKDYIKAMQKIEQLRNRLLEAKIFVIREKIELVMYDVRWKQP